MLPALLTVVLLRDEIFSTGPLVQHNDCSSCKFFFEKHSMLSRTVFSRNHSHTWTDFIINVILGGELLSYID
jgi:hypothetical protein